MSTPGRPAFSFAVPVGNISANPVTVRMSASREECEALARQWGVSSVSALDAELHLTRWKRDGVRVSGQVRAELVQPSVVSLEPVASVVDEPVDAVFVPEGSRLARPEPNDSGEWIVDPEGPDAPETFSGDAIDVGNAVSECVALAIEPYPRLPGEIFTPPDQPEEEEADGDSPFAALRDWPGRKS